MSRDRLRVGNKRGPPSSQPTELAQPPADRGGFSRSYMCRIERGRANPSLDAIETLAGGLKISVAKLFED
ncbi:MAG: hypothetical protein A3G41_05900 [Elusimicrobia bacterium RIFCSPLOWO2_12_FULL_59_9]|nr:MAG: hypothetical protein A3G41_05900 [Elusimicrobia bacterium RIFCSPLOWO2_12_FULL_59_9]